MLVFFVTDIDVSGNGDEIVSRSILQEALHDAVNTTFNRISVDTDTSTSDTITLMSSGSKTVTDVSEFRRALKQMCAQLSDDVVRNGEGVSHVMRCRVAGALNEEIAVAVGKSVVNSPLLKCAVNGNDPNVGRLISSVGKYFSQPGIDTNIVSSFNPSNCSVSIGNINIFKNGQFTLSEQSEEIVMRHMKHAELYESRGAWENEQVTYASAESFPKHKRCVEIDIHLGMKEGKCEATVLGSSLSHEYVAENADYRS